MEIHFHGPLLARSESPDAAPSVEHREEREDDDGDGDGGGRPSALPAVVALIVLVVLGYAVRRLRARGDHQTTLDEPTG